MKSGRRKTSDAVEMLNRMAGDDPELKRLTEKAREEARRDMGVPAEKGRRLVDAWVSKHSLPRKAKKI
jgi:hypothetical protein